MFKSLAKSNTSYKKNFALVFFVVLALSTTMTNAQANRATTSSAPATSVGINNPDENLISQPFVTVNGQVRNHAQAELLLREQIQRGAANTPELHSAVREVLINQSLMSMAAQQAGLDRLPLVQAQIELARQNTLAQAWQETVVRELQITDAEFLAEYERQVSILGPNEFQIRHLLVAEEATAKLLLDRIQAGSSMASLAAEFSRDEASKGQGGLVGWTPQGQLLPPLLQAVQGLSAGDRVPTPVRTEAGWHVVQLEDRRPFRAPDIQQVRPQLAQALAQQRIQQRLADLRRTAQVK